MESLEERNKIHMHLHILVQLEHFSDHMIKSSLRQLMRRSTSMMSDGSGDVPMDGLTDRTADGGKVKRVWAPEVFIRPNTCINGNLLFSTASCHVLLMSGVMVGKAAGQDANP